MSLVCPDRRTPILVSCFTDLWRNASVLRYTFCQHPTGDVLARRFGRCLGTPETPLKFPHSIDALPNEVRTQLAQKKLESWKEFLQRLESNSEIAPGSKFATLCARCNYWNIRRTAVLEKLPRAPRPLQRRPGGGPAPRPLFNYFLCCSIIFALRHSAVKGRPNRFHAKLGLFS